MDRCAIFVDAGYLFAAGGQLCRGTRSRKDLAIDGQAVNDLLVRVAHTRCLLPVLRTYWYDGARDGIPTAEHQAIARLPNIKVRLGRLNGRNEQKGVDALIYRDLMTLARERAIADAYLLSGDEDLREGVRAAQDMGVRVTLIGIPGKGGERFNQSRELVNEADEVVKVTKTQLDPVFPAPEPTLPMELGPIGPAQAEEQGVEFGKTWRSSATDEELGKLLALRPNVPRALDGELLRHVEGRLKVDLRDKNELRLSARRGFWTAVGD